VKFTALALAGFCVVTVLLFHANFTDRAQMVHFLKNVALAGGLLALYVSGPGRMSFDGTGEEARLGSRVRSCSLRPAAVRR
jgi:putative oxidoreductase